MRAATEREAAVPAKTDRLDSAHRVRAAALRERAMLDRFIADDTQAARAREGIAASRAASHHQTPGEKGRAHRVGAAGLHEGAAAQAADLEPAVDD